jgi:hypothetical protein
MMDALRQHVRGAEGNHDRHLIEDIGHVRALPPT